MYLVDAGRTIPASREISIRTLPTNSRQRAFQMIFLASAQRARIIDLLFLLFLVLFVSHLNVVCVYGPLKVK